MPRLPQMQVRNIRKAIPIADNSANLAAQALGEVAKIGTRIQSVQDTTNANKELSTFQLDSTKKSDELALLYGDNPAKYEEEFSKYIAESKDNLEANTQVSIFNKRNFKEAVGNSMMGLEEIKYKNTRKLQFNKVQNDIVTTTANYNDLSYTYGKDGDIEQLENIELVEMNKLIASSENVLSPDKREALKAETTTGIYENYLTGGVVARPAATLAELEAGQFDKKLDAVTIDKFKDLARKSLKRAEDERKKGEKDAKIILGTQNVIRLESKLNTMNVSKVGEIKTSEFNNLDSIINFNAEVEAVKGTLSEKEYRKYKERAYTMTSSLQDEFKAKDEGYFGLFPEKNPGTARYAEIYINRNMSPYDNFDNSQVYLDVMTEARARNIPLESKNMRDKKQINLIIRDKVASYYDVDPTASDFNKQVNERLTRKIFNENTQIINSASQDIQTNYDPANILGE